MTIIQETPIPDAYLISLERHVDERGFFSRTICIDELAKCGIEFSVDQISTSYNRFKGTLRGMHYQQPMWPEIKIVRCTRGVIYDVVLDLRMTSPTYLNWIAFELSAQNGLAILVPEGCAHGFQTLRDDSEVLYTNSGQYKPAAAKTVRWNDHAFKIEWPDCNNRIMSNKDRDQPDFVA
jgi:dTDP-4-dehydrorhamnose 3,5-epimerase